jgi:predicted small metal-binding protein
MKTMKCVNLGGACEKEFSANSFEEIAELSKAHAMEMMQKADAPHLEAMNKMRSLMETPNAMNDWFEAKRNEFNNL